MQKDAIYLQIHDIDSKLYMTRQYIQSIILHLPLSCVNWGPSASTGEHCICIVSDLLRLGLGWSCFVFCLLFLLFYVISSIGNGGIGTKCAENPTRKKCAKIPRSNISGMSGMPRSNFPRSNRKKPVLTGKMGKCNKNKKNHKHLKRY